MLGAPQVLQKVNLLGHQHFFTINLTRQDLKEAQDGKVYKNMFTEKLHNPHIFWRLYTIIYSDDYYFYT